MSTILIVDDEAPIRRLLAKILEGDGYTCTLVADALAARAHLAATRYDLLLTDINMPGESGLDLAAQVNTAYQDTAVVFVSVMDDPDEARAALQLGAYGYLVKPFDRNQALITVGNALVRRDLEIAARNHLRDLERKVRERTVNLTELVAALQKAKEKNAAVARYHQDQTLFLQTLMDAIPNPIYYKDRSGVYQGCNHAFEKFTGRARDAILGHTVHDILPDTAASLHQQVDQKLLCSPGHELYEASAAYADGSVHDALFSKATYQDSEGRVAGLVGVMMDITERKKMERALRVSEEKNRTILENIGIGVALISPQMTILEMNPKMRQWVPEDAIEQGLHCYQFQGAKDKRQPCRGCPVFQTLSDGLVHEAVIQRREGQRERSLRIVSSPIRDNAGQVVAAIELVDDITEHLAMERELRQAQKLSSLGQLAAGVAHEINNPTG
ncbi:MAG: response regulator, partial [Desulfatitalea sp.]|nr:response regulator [Desulfatitalea sp.]